VFNNGQSNSWHAELYDSIRQSFDIMQFYCSLFLFFFFLGVTHPISPAKLNARNVLRRYAFYAEKLTNEERLGNDAT
jgi:hypothetical protein